MATKLSDALATLSAKTKNLENKIAASSKDSKDKLDKTLAESKADLQAKKDQFVRHAEAVNAKTSADWDSFKGSINHKVAQLKADIGLKNASFKEKVEAKKSQMDAAAAQRRYNDAVDYATSCIEWAGVALSEVEDASLGVLEAQAEVDALTVR